MKRSERGKMVHLDGNYFQILYLAPKTWLFNKNSSPSKFDVTVH